MVIFRLPDYKNFFLIEDSSGKETNFQFFPFLESDALNFSGNCKEISETEIRNLKIDSDSLPNLSNAIFEEKSNYLQNIQKAIELIKLNHLQKLVYSRRIKLEYKSVDAIESFINLCNSYANAFAYLLITNDECWIGAFSELLGKYNHKTSEFTTMSLAGTLPISESWSNKEIQEHGAVSDFIFSTLKQYGTQVEKQPTVDHFSGAIKHLRNDFKATIDPTKVDSLIKALHPTPAVLGIPKELCLKLIEKLESNPREYYAGYSHVKMGDISYYYVNLRCSKLFSSHAEIFVGGGITAQSKPEKEWTETILKSKAILDNLVYTP